MRITSVAVISLAIFAAVAWLNPDTSMNHFYLSFLLMEIGAITLWRWAYATLFKLLPVYHRVLVVGYNKQGKSIATLLRDAPNLKYQVVGYVDDGLAERSSASDGLPIWGQSASLLDLVHDVNIHEVIVALEQRVPEHLFQRLVECQANGVRLSLTANIYEELYQKLPVEFLNADWMLWAIQNQPVFNRLQLGLKRLVDLVLALIGFLVLMLTFPFVALAIRLDSPGNIFYRQARCGRGGQLLSIIKFRTMTSNAEADGQARWASKDDARITRVGRFLRKTRLDELPQVINVLRGEMSIIGPRPERPEFVQELEQSIPFYRLRLLVKPGLTGWAQTHYEYGNSAEDALIKLEYDLYYLRFWSLWLDIYIIFRTISIVLRCKGM
jgi:exopolysaccharide biosynthesis polyprenyl glycosylphosphotransferase